MARTGFKRPGRYAALAACYYDDPAIISIGPEAELWYVRALAWCAAHPETDGVIPIEVAVNRLGIPNAMSHVTACDSHNLVTKNHDSVSVTSWVKWNDSWRDIQERNDAKRAAARERKARERARKSEQAKRDAATRDMERDITRDSRRKEKGERRKESITTPLLEPPSSESPTTVTPETPTVAADAAPATASATSVEAKNPSPRARSARGTRLPDGWQPDQALADWTRTNCPAAANNAEVERFCDYWQSLSGQRAVRGDWRKTWRNWARRCQEQASQPRPGPAQRATTDDRVLDWLALADSLDPTRQPTAQPALIAIEGGAA